MKLDLNKLKNNIKDNLRSLRKDKRREFDNKTLDDFKKLEIKATEELKDYLKEWSLRYPEIIRVSMASGMGEYFSFRTDEVDKISVKLKFGLGIESI